MESIEFFVPGIPRPGGSKEYKGKSKAGKAIIIDSSGVKGKNWRADVKAFAIRSFCEKPSHEPIGVKVRFQMPRPKYHYRTGKHAGEIKPQYLNAQHVTAPDTTKLFRSLEDALTGILWADDAQIVQQNVCKAYAEIPGAVVEAWSEAVE